VCWFLRSIGGLPAAAGFTPAAAGFTLVELITVVLLLGILSVFAASRMLGANAYIPAHMAGDVIAVSRLAQQTALARQDASVSVVVDVDAADWRSRVFVNEGTADTAVYTSRTERRNSTSTVVNGALSAPVTAAEPLRIVFDGLGNVTSAAVGGQVLDPSLGIRIDVVGDTAYALCIAPTGFVQRGACA
jgi:MSHA pilin protein MshC